MRAPKIGVAVAVSILLSIASGVAFGQTQITLGGSSQAVVFQGMGSGTHSVGVTLGSCNKQGQCRLSGKAGGSSMAYMLMSTAGSITMALLNAAAGIWSVHQSSSIGFAYGPNGSVLSGFLNLVRLIQAPGTKSGTVANANLVITGGTLAPLFSSGHALLNVTLAFPRNVNLQSLLGTKGRVRAKFSGGTLVPTPEPSSMFLLGAGLLAAGATIRTRARRSHSQS